METHAVLFTPVRLGAIELAHRFDGAEILAAGGYLLDQFLQNGTNRRKDRYGGTIENRARLLLEVTSAVADVWPADRVGVRISPSGTFNGISDSEPESIFDHVAGALDRFGLAYLHIIEPRVRGGTTVRRSTPAAPAGTRTTLSRLY